MYIDFIASLKRINNYFEKNDCLYYNDKLLKYNGVKNINTLTITANEISDGAFQNLKVNELIFSKGIEIISDNAFKSSEINKIVFPNSLKQIDLSKQEINSNYIVFDNDSNVDIINNSKEVLGKKVFLDSEYNENVVPLLNLLKKAELLYNDKKYDDALEKLYKYFDNDDALKLIDKCENEIYNDILEKIKKGSISNNELEKFIEKIDGLKRLNKNLKNSLIDQINAIIEKNNENERNFNKALNYFNEQKYHDAYCIFKKISSYKDSFYYLTKIKENIRIKYKLDFQKIDKLDYVKETISVLELYDEEELIKLKKLYIEIESNAKRLLYLKEYLTNQTDINKVYSKMLDIKSWQKYINAKVLNDIYNEIMATIKKIIINIDDSKITYKEILQRIQCLVSLKLITDVSECAIFFKNKMQVSDKFTYNNINYLNDKIECLVALNNLIDVSDLIEYNKKLKDKIITSYNNKKKIKKIIKTVLFIIGVIALALISYYIFFKIMLGL